MSASWRQQAACIGADPAIFHILSREDVGYEHMTDDERKDIEVENMAKALSYCDRCPVTDECLDFGRQVMSSSEDIEGVNIPGKHFSVYGGVLPEGHTPRKRGRPVGGASMDTPCSKGHPSTEKYKEPRGTVRCRACAREAKQIREETRADGTYMYKSRAKRHEDNALGHEYDPLPNLRKGEKQPRCRECVRIARKKYNDSQSIEKKAKRGIKAIGVTVEQRHEAMKGHAPTYRVVGGRRECATCREQQRQKRLRLKAAV